MDTYFLKMLRCLELAKIGQGKVAPNPMVGAVLCIGDHIISEGYHRNYGESHAEINAINQVSNKSLLKESTLFVNLEPCSHYGKTPPCADRIIECGIPKVVVGMVDPNPLVANKGIVKLREAGIEVIQGVLENECKQLNKRFITFHDHRRPYIILKWAETSDGYIDIIRKNSQVASPNWITDETARMLVHKWRTEEQAILVGTNTALYDNPKLTARDWPGKNPVRMVIDKSGRLPQTLALFDRTAPTVVFVSENNTLMYDHIQNLKANMGELFPDWFGNYCYQQGISSVIVEGGAKLFNTFIGQGYWDEARVFKGDIQFGDGIKAPSINRVASEKTRLFNSELQIYYNNS